MKIVCIGDNCIDSYDETGKRYPGGNAVNVAVCQRRLDPKMGILGGVFKLEGGVMAAMPMLPVYDKLTACKRVDGMEF